MIDGRKAGAELCETSRLALYLACLGQRARLHQAPLFSRPFLENAAGSGGLLRESAALADSFGKQPTAAGQAKSANANGEKKPPF